MDGSALIVPPAPRVHARPISKLRMVAGMLRNPLAVYCEQDFERSISRGRMLGRDNIGLSEPAAVRHVLTTAAAKYRRPVVAVRALRYMMGNGLLLAEGDTWRGQRRMLAPVFSPAHVGELLPHFHAAGGAMIGRLEDRTEADLSSEFNQASLDALLRALFSTPADTQGREMAGLVRRYISGPGRPRFSDTLARREEDFRWLSGGRRRFRDQWFAAVDALVDARRRSPRTDDTRDLLDVLFAARDPETGAMLPPEDIRDQAATMLTAGFETTARLLFWAAYLLALDRREQAAIRREIESFPPERVASLDDLDNWPRLRCTLLETMRLYPPLALVVRQAIAPDEVLGEAIEPGDLIWISPWTLHRHRAHWTHPTAFMPSRFAGQPQPWTHGAFMPFGGGPRTCIGASFAMAEAQILLATLLERFEIGLVDTRPVMPIGRVTTVPDHEPRFSLRAYGA